MQFKYQIETDPVSLLYRERSYEIHKSRIVSAEKIIDNSSPATARFTKFISRTPVKSAALEHENSIIFGKLNKIYQRPYRPPRSLIPIKTSPLINRTRQAARIANENETLAKRLINKKATVSLKSLQQQYKVKEEYREMISKINQIKKSRMLIKNSLNTY